MNYNDKRLITRTDPRNFSIEGQFTMGELTNCEDIRYLKVTVVRGNVLVTSGIDLGPTASKSRLAPIKFVCDVRKLLY